MPFKVQNQASPNKDPMTDSAQYGIPMAYYGHLSTTECILMVFFPSWILNFLHCSDLFFSLFRPTFDERRVEMRGGGTLKISIFTKRVHFWASLVRPRLP